LIDLKKGVDYLMQKQDKKPMLTKRGLLSQKVKKYVRLTRNNSYNSEIQLRKKQAKCKHIAKVVFKPTCDCASLVCSKCGVLMAKVGQF
jgi:hypothetical protein